ncbi:MAG: hypothetical protein IGS48_01055 [Oscillatoriales cyanobacterium C42_A2020_001]|nr:hypothetical protein [Leptolyngbyaceae cyanobacterium C42_A2020_001]
MPKKRSRDTWTIARKKESSLPLLSLLLPEPERSPASNKPRSSRSTYDRSPPTKSDRPIQRRKGRSQSKLFVIQTELF